MYRGEGRGGEIIGGVVVVTHHADILRDGKTQLSCCPIYTEGEGIAEADGTVKTAGICFPNFHKPAITAIFIGTEPTE